MKGFIYITTNTINSRQYIGRKYYFDKNGNETNWKTYLGSSNALKQDIKLYGKENFTREILIECKTAEELFIKETEYINSFNAVNNPQFYNISNNTCKIATTKESIQRGLETRKYWSAEKKAEIFKKLQNRFAHLSPAKQKEMKKNVSKRFKNNPEFKKMRSEVQSKVWNAYNEEQKQAILKKRSNSVKQAWENLSYKQKLKHKQIRKDWHSSLTPEQKREHVNKIKQGKNLKTMTLVNIVENFEVYGTIRELSEKYNISTNVLHYLNKKAYSVNNIYKKTWTAK